MKINAGGFVRGDKTTEKSVKFQRLFDPREVFQLRKGCVFTIGGERHYLRSISGMDFGNGMVKVYGKAEKIK